MPELSWLDRLILGLDITSDVLEGYQDAIEPNSPGGVDVTPDEVFKIGSMLLSRVAQASGHPINIVPVGDTSSPAQAQD